MAQRLCLLLLLCLALLGVVRGQSSSPFYCRFNSRHTLCIHPFGQPGSNCGGGFQKRGLSNEDARLILHEHNRLRSLVASGNEARGAPGPQPPANNMRLLEWDDELSRVAQSHADQCIFEHECSDCRRVERFGVGQNLFISFQSNFNERVQWRRAIKAWYEEVAEFSNQHINPFRFSTPVGHYTQMMWWNTVKIGCGFTMYQEGGWWKKLYTCNYGPGGNIISSSMYQHGAPCSNCPSGTSCSPDYPGLCGPTSSPDFSSNQILQSRTGTPAVFRTRAPAPQTFSEPAPQRTVVPAPQRTPVPATFTTSAFSTFRTVIPTAPTTTFNPQLFFNQFRFNQEAEQQEFEPQEPAEFEPFEAEAQEHEPFEPQEQQEQEQQEFEQQEQEQEQMFIPFHGEQPQVTDLMPFLKRAGMNTQVIRTHSLSSVQSIINSLPQGLMPIVLFRAGNGALTELDAGSLLPLIRTGRSTTTTKVPKMLPDFLLDCDLDSSPCDVTPVGANWTVGSSQSEGRYAEAALLPGEGAQLVYQKLVTAPTSEGICVSFSHRRSIEEGGPANATIPELMVGVMPIGGEVRRKTVGGAPDMWEMSRVSFGLMKRPFLVVMTIAPSDYHSTVAIDALQITDGLCCMSGIC